MKARLIQNQDSVQLLLCTGKILDVTNTEALAFLLNYNDVSYYKGNGTWDYENLTMEEYRGETIAYVCDDDILHVVNASLFRRIFDKHESNFITAQEYGELYGKQSSIIRRLCRTGRLLGAIQKGGAWLIPQDSPYPSDERVRY